MFKVTVKWNAQKYEGLEVNTQEPVEMFKAQLYSLTGVEPSRQKLLTKGKFLKDETDLTTIPFQDGQLVTMMGTVGEIATAPIKPTVFLEDLSEAEVNQALELPSGLVNLGNTCYMNSSLQLLQSIPELRAQLDSYSGVTQDSDPQLALVASLKDLFSQLKASGEGHPPFVFLQFLRMAFPMFSQQEGRGVYSQQDAEECWSSIITSLQRHLKGSNGASFVDQYMSGQFKVKMSCPEAPEEPPSLSTEPFLKLDCHISKDVNHLTSGLSENFRTELDKNSPSLGRQARYIKELAIDRLPLYLPVTFVRFFWKPAERVKAKILKKVKFPFELDLYPHCTKELQEKLDLARAKARELDEADKQAQADGAAKPTPEELQQAFLRRQQAINEAAHPDLKDNAGNNLSGHYQLQAVLTHTGRTADSGHYMGWVRREGFPNQWFKYDDDKVSIVDDAAIKNLDGGGDWHMAYILLYGPARG
ncbi:deubiquitinating enzyme [Entomophthora muscae]|uniref:Deubiquitinating enzyme n=1 Tax=Entomophthora muscae TaxID=34485 RepID=A0ACC2RDR0_9FUNG|nr:deubiquitinating enzyme [Entomophthora muscae]